MSERVFLISNGELKAFHWGGNKLTNFYEFTTNEEALHEFEEYLKITSNQPCKILLDLLEEEFQTEKIPHLTGADRKIVINRLVARYYRDCKYSHSHQIGREKTGRKDDEILLSCISNTEPIDVWLEKIHQHQVPLSGIWSLSIISELLIAKLKKKKYANDIILISKQLQSIQRESYIRNGKLVLSRLVQINNGEDDNQENKNETNSAKKLYQFLLNKRYLNYTTVTDFLYLMPFELVAHLKVDDEDSKSSNYHFLAIDEVASEIGIRLDDNTTILLYANPEAIFTYLCSKQPSRTNHYAPLEDRKAFLKIQGNHIVSCISYFGSLILFSLAALCIILFMDGFSENKELENQKNNLEAHYNSLYSNNFDQLQSTYQIKDYVLLSRQLKEESKRSPEDLFKPLSHTLSQPYFSNIKISGFEWKKIHGTELTAFITKLKEKTQGSSNEISGQNYDDNSGNGSNQESRVPILTIRGSLSQAEAIYRHTVIIMEEFVKSIESNPMVTSTWVQRVPVDIRKNSQYTGERGSMPSNSSAREDSEKFEIVIMLQPTPFILEASMDDDDSYAEDDDLYSDGGSYE